MRVLILLFSLLLSAFSFASEKTELKSFLQNNELMPASGAFAGQKIENKEKRSLIFLTPAQKKVFGIDPYDLAFANFRHNETFYIATIPSMKVYADNTLYRASQVVEEVAFVKAHWAAKERPQTASVEVHSELLFKFKNTAGIKLIYNQNKANYIEPIILNKAVFSIEAVRSAAEPNADFFKYAMGDNFAVANRFYSFAERKIRYRNDPGVEFSVFPLDFSNTKSFSQRANSQDYLLFQSLSSSHYYGRNQTYNLFTSNCTNRAFDLLDYSMKYNANTTGKINFSYVEENYVQWINDDLDELIDFLAIMAQSKGYELPIELKYLSKNGSKSLALKYLADMKKTWGTEANMKNVFYNLPMFIEGHLKARGLVK